MLFRYYIALCAAGCVLLSTAMATVLVPAEFREIVNGSDIIAFGRVVDAMPQLSDDRSRVETLVTMEVATYLKGGPGETIVFSVPGGQIGRFGSLTIGAPTFAIGDEAVVFLNSRGRPYPSVFGLNQGVFRVRLDTATKRRIVVPPALLARGESPEVVTRGAAARQAVPIETFGAQVQSVLGEAARRGGR